MRKRAVLSSLPLIVLWAGSASAEAGMHECYRPARAVGYLYELRANIGCREARQAAHDWSWTKRCWPVDGGPPVRRCRFDNGRMWRCRAEQNHSTGRLSVVCRNGRARRVTFKASP